MKKSNGKTLLTCAAVLALAAGTAHAGWKTYEAEEYGFRMSYAPGTRFVEKDHGGGWAGLKGTHPDGIAVYAFCALGKNLGAEAIERAGTRFTKVPAGRWRLVDRGVHEQGWRWYRTVEHIAGSRVVFGGYGVGPGGSYMMVMETTLGHYREYKADYRSWYRSIVLSQPTMEVSSYTVPGSPGSWQTYAAPSYRFRMPVPGGTQVEERTWTGGWGGVVGRSNETTFHGLALRGEDADPDAIARVGEQVTGIPADDWTTLDEGEGRKGWNWYAAVRARRGDRLFFGGYGQGKGHSYLLLLETTPESYLAHRREYEAWYQGVRLQ